MKKTRRLLALLLTFAALVSLLAFPIAVAEDADCVAPRVRVGQCPYCVDGTLYFVAHYDAVIVNGDIMTYDLYQCNSCGATMMANVSYG